jgi:acetyl esterase/lipase
MSSIQSEVSNLIIKTFRNSLFIHKTQTETHRYSFERISRITKLPKAVQMEDTLVGEIQSRWFIPDQVKQEETVLYYLHGGGYCVGSVYSHRALIGRLAREIGCKAIGINYRLAPEHPYPAALEDSLKVYKYLIESGYKKIIVAGDSAGGGLSLATIFKARDLGWNLPFATILISPWVDLTQSGETIKTKATIDPLIAPELLEVFASKYCAQEDPTNKYLSPLFGDMKDMPPTIIQVGSKEILLDDSYRLAKKLNKANVKVNLEVWENQMHVWHWLGGILPEANQAIKKIGAFINKLIEEDKISQNLQKARNATKAQ